MDVIPIFTSTGITGFESPTAEYSQLAFELDELLIEHLSSTFIGRACGDSMQGVAIFAPKIDSDSMFKMSLNCYPEKSQFDFELNLVAG